MKFKVEIEVPDFPSSPMPVEVSRISQILGYIGSSEIEYAINHHNQRRKVGVQYGIDNIGEYWVEDGLTKAEKRETAETVIGDYKSNWENAIGDFFASKKKQKGNI